MKTTEKIDPQKARVLRLRKAKTKMARLAASCQRRALRTVRRKIAWALTHYPQETREAAKETLKRWGRGNPLHDQWRKLLGREDKELAQILQSTKKDLQELNSCHPFGGAIRIYEKHH